MKYLIIIGIIYVLYKVSDSPRLMDHKEDKGDDYIDYEEVDENE